MSERLEALADAIRTQLLKNIDESGEIPFSWGEGERANSDAIEDVWTEAGINTTPSTAFFTMMLASGEEALVKVALTGVRR